MHATAERTMGRKKTAEKPSRVTPEVAKIDPDVMDHARIVVAFTGEGLGSYLSRLLRPLVITDRNEIVKTKGLFQADSPPPKRKP